ncbi:MAG TPA: HEAT repeat domain-containing protein [Gemmatimonadales bacterium]|nr:HEAT repeat domain-containing protein [Gemmatimonadales bacterium]
MTAQPEVQPTTVPTAQVVELMAAMVKALRAFQIYLPNNPIHQRAIQNVQAACAPIWSGTDELVLNISESEFSWEDQVVYRQTNKNESLSWSLFKDGMRAVTIRRGAEEKELPLLLATINQARFLPPDAGDDLPTLLWEHEFEFIEYRFIDFFSGEGGGTAMPQAVGQAAGEGMTSSDRKARVAEDAPARAKSLIEIDDVDSTLYFLDEAEISYLARELEEEYQRDVRGSAFNILFDLFEVYADPNVRQEILRVLERLFPNLLNARDYRSAAAVLRESKLLRDKALQLQPELIERLEVFVTKLSEPAIVGQLLQSLDEASHLGVDTHAAEVLRELRATALEPLVGWLPNLTSDPLRKMLEEVVDRLAHSYPAEVQRILKLPESPALLGMVTLCGRLGLHQAVQALAETINHPDPAIRLAVVQTLGLLGTPGAMTVVDKAIEDEDRNVRLAAVRSAGSRGYKGALRRVEAVVLGKALKDIDLTEKMAFFEAYGSIAGANALKPLSALLLERGLLRMKEPPETRACAAMALGRLKTAEAREVLQRAQDDKELVVRNAVNRALREAAK